MRAATWSREQPLHIPHQLGKNNIVEEINTIAGICDVKLDKARLLHIRELIMCSILAAKIIRLAKIVESRILPGRSKDYQT